MFNQKRHNQFRYAFFQDAFKRAQQFHDRQVELERRSINFSQSSRLLEFQLWAQAGMSEARYLRFLRTKEELSNYTFIRTIGKGHYGEVKLVRKKENGRLYALKRMAKSEALIDKKRLARARAERDALAESDSEWVVKLHSAFQDKTSLYLLMEFLPGGDLMMLLMHAPDWTESAAVFYGAEITMAIEAVHDLGYIHRDIKPDNILLDRNGHIKLADFGGAKNIHARHNMGRYIDLLGDERVPKRDYIGGAAEWEKEDFTTNSIVGTLRYMAPELILEQQYSYEVDYLITDNATRLGREGANEIKAHPFFAQIDFTAPGLRQSRAPFIPKLRSLDDTSFFPIDELPQDDWPLPPPPPPRPCPVVIPADEDEGHEPGMVLPFVGFSFRRHLNPYM
ncbi:kinase-like domain-containing protein [Chaetomidium leptoderma]|uniref:non-specific serine/threonine protein kinase n=1 Tax=Chaetomidium leptoderma TaxID=669021 RepID=A0AAN6ZT89_9PEZI|nr:kinase-like domain-containing protein [Chaetomidium leptoderma]